jgi:sorting nexin-29
VFTAWECKEEIEEYLGKSDIEGQTIESTWMCIKQLICKAVENALGFYPKRVRNEWFNNEFKDALEVRNTVHMKMLQRETRANMQAYRNAQREAKLICKRKKKQYEEQVLEELQESFKNNDSRKFYEGICKIRKGKNKQGVIVGDEKGILEAWVDYFKGLLNPLDKGIVPEEKVYFGPEQDIRAPSVQEVSAIIRKLKNNRAPGENSITAELVKDEGRMLWRKVHILMQRMWKEEQMPEEWNSAIVCPIYKKGKKIECNNYQGFSLLNVTYKVFTQLVAKCVELYVEDILGDYL